MPLRPYRRDEAPPIEALKRVMPKVDPVDVPHDPTLLEQLTEGFWDKTNDGVGDVSTRIKDDGKQR